MRELGGTGDGGVGGWGDEDHLTLEFSSSQETRMNVALHSRMKIMNSALLQTPEN